MRRVESRECEMSGCAERQFLDTWREEKEFVLYRSSPKELNS